jgi:hypothetical protein
MNARLAVMLVALVVLLASAALLVTGSPILMWQLPGFAPWPAGTLIAWAGLVSFPLAVYTGLGDLHPPKRLSEWVTARALKMLLVLALAWGPISYWLAGNFRFNFGNNDGFRGSETAFFVFLYYSLALVLLPAAVLLFHAVFKLLFRRPAAR